MKQLLIGLFILLFSPFYLNAQQLNLAAKNAFLITRMADKFHFQPRTVDDQFSKDVFQKILFQLDKEKILFTLADIRVFEPFQYLLDEEVKNKDTTFLALLSKSYDARIKQVLSDAALISKSPHDYWLTDKIKNSDATSYPVDNNSRRTKLAKYLKRETLEIILKKDGLDSLTHVALRKYVDSIEPIARQKAVRLLEQRFKMITSGEGGIEKFVGDEYCKAIALSYDPHTEYFPLKEKEDFEARLGHDRMVFGFTCKEGDDGSVEIDNIFPGSPAFKSGQINKGDQLLSVQWENKAAIEIGFAGLRQASEILAMSNHEKAILKLRKPDGTERSVALYKEEMQDDDANKVKSLVLRGEKTIGFISLPSFYQDWEGASSGNKGCANDVSKEILKLKQENIQGLILDLRYNGGGSMQEAIDLSGIFVDAGPVGMEKNNAAKLTTLKDVSRGIIYDGPLIILINGYTASAAEMVAGTLQDYHRAIIIGSPSYGKATAQIVLPLDTSSVYRATRGVSEDFVKVTIAGLYRVTGFTVQAKGVQPDIVLPDYLDAHPQREADNDNVLMPLPVEANKYFKPYSEIPFENVKSLATQKVSKSEYFQAMQAYISSSRSSNHKEINLHLPSAIAEANAELKVIREMKTTKANPPFEVDNTALEKQQLKHNAFLNELNDEWRKFLNNDRSIHLTYELLASGIK